MTCLGAPFTAAKLNNNSAAPQILLAKFHAVEGKVALASKILADALTHKPPSEAETRVRVALFTLQVLACGLPTPLQGYLTCKKTHPVGPYRRPMPEVLGGS